MTMPVRKLAWSERAGGLLLYLYPAEFRIRFGDEILAVLSESGRHLWICDFLTSILRERAGQLLGRIRCRPSFSMWPDAAALFGIAMNVALWAQVMAVVVVSRSNFTNRKLIIVWAVFAIGFGVLSVLTCLAIRRSPPRSHVWLKL